MTPEPVIVHVEPLGVDLELAPGETVIEAAWRLGYEWPTVCWGQATCTACILDVLEGDDRIPAPAGDERVALDTGLTPSVRRQISRPRLACRAAPTGPVVVRKEGVKPKDG